MSGVAVGSSVAVGFDVLVGCGVCVGIGTCVGIVVSVAVGTEVTVSVGTFVGTFVGSSVGVFVGGTTVVGFTTMIVGVAGIGVGSVLQDTNHNPEHKIQVSTRTMNTTILVLSIFRNPIV